MNIITNGVLLVKRIDEICIKKGTSRKEVANHCGISTNTISTWISRGTIPAADIAIKIAEYLDVSVEWLVTGHDRENLTDEDRDLLLDYHTISEQEKPIIRQQIKDAAIRGLKKNESVQSNIG